MGHSGFRRSRAPCGDRPEAARPARALAAASGRSAARRRRRRLDLYGHLFPDRLDDLADRMDAFVCAPDVPHEGPHEDQ